MPILHSGCLVEGTIRLRNTGGRYSVYLSHRDIEIQDYVFLEEDIILDLDVTPLIDNSRSYFMGLNSVTNRV
jgi:hypothetical protein